MTQPNQPEVTVEDTETPSAPSKTQRKNAAQALTDLGRRLVELKPQQLATIPLPDDVAEAVREARAINSHGARKRQLQYLGKLLRRIDVDAIQQALEQTLAPGRREAALTRSAEQWRLRLLDEGDTALGEFLQQQPNADRQQLRQLLRQCQQLGMESTRGKQAFRQLFRAVHEQLSLSANEA